VERKSVPASVDMPSLLDYRPDGSIVIWSANSTVEEIVGFLEFDAKSVQESILMNLESFIEARPHIFQERNFVLKFDPVVFEAKYKLADVSLGILESLVLGQERFAISRCE